MFFDDGRPAYIALPSLHLVCKTSKEIKHHVVLLVFLVCCFLSLTLVGSFCLSAVTSMFDDIEDETWRAELEEYLQTYPNPIFVVMRVGQDCKVDRNGHIELCTVTQVDGSLIEICYQVRESFSPLGL